MNPATGQVGRMDEFSEPERARVVTLGAQAEPLQGFAELVQRMREAQGEVDPEEAARAYAEASAQVEANGGRQELVELSREEAERLAAVNNENLRLKQFRKLRATAPCNVCQRLIGNHSDKQMRRCFKAMADALERQSITEAKLRASKSVKASTIHQV